MNLSRLFKQSTRCITYKKTTIINDNGKVVRETTVLSDGGECETEAEVNKMREQMEDIIKKMDEFWQAFNKINIFK